MKVNRLLSLRGGLSRRGDARGGVWRVLPLLALAAALFAAGAAPAAAAGSTSARSAHTTSTTSTTSTTNSTTTAAKPKPVPPTGIAVGTANVPKPHTTSHVGVRPMTTWTVSLSVSAMYLWPTQYSTLTATASQDVGPTPYFIYIINANTGAAVAACGSGTTCAVTLTYPTPTYDYFYAIIATSSAGANQQAMSAEPGVEWRGIQLTLAASLNTLPVGNTSTLTATSDTDISSSPFYIQIWDTTAGGGPLNAPYTCGTGTTCSVSVSQSVATTHAFVATFAYDSTTYPPSGLQTTSATSYVTWTASGWTISLNAPAQTINGPETITATANGDVGPTPYYIQIFDENGTRIASCGSGSTCSVSYTPARYPGSCFVAFVASYSTTLPPANIQASSNTACSQYVYIG
ncbi:MAG TPA: hypothetical protein VGS97_12620 [Actinocrinis sp.]|uniref:hypothetical protein n=1 Tax=Actinocrinis sp. TaxID=1920516 RepID=UPI002DDCC87A|nr:hypothetical protein [Actinocrinis sp.]HEV2344932.1 hypothetical protein [Actinocrinis sp.]